MTSVLIGDNINKLLTKLKLLNYNLKINYKFEINKFVINNDNKRLTIIYDLLNNFYNKVNNTKNNTLNNTLNNN
jgi:hypothetical protein